MVGLSLLAVSAFVIRHQVCVSLGATRVEREKETKKKNLTRLQDTLSLTVTVHRWRVRGG